MTFKRAYLVILGSALTWYTSADAAGLDETAVAAALAKLRTFQTDLRNLESSLALARGSLQELVMERRLFPFERRLIDADLLFETGDYERAAVLYRELLENPAAKGQPVYYKIAIRLGEALYHLGKFTVARYFLERAALPEAGPEYPLALAKLFDIAVKTGDFASYDRFARAAETIRSPPPDLLYAYGKFLYYLGRLPAAEQVLARVQDGSKPYARACYLLGVIAVRTGRLEQAIEQFTKAASAAEKDGDHEMLGIAQVARARLYTYLQRYDESLAAAQKVPIASSSYAESLYEIAWAEFQRGNMSGAIHALDILLLTRPAGDLALRAMALRGRLASRLDEPETAREAYEATSAELTPLVTDLDRLAQDPKGLESYFEWVAASQADRLRLEMPASQRTISWLQADPDMNLIVTALAEIRQQGSDLQAAMELANRLLWALRSGGKLVSFPALKERLIRLKDLENSFVRLALDALEVARSVVGGQFQGEIGAQYEAWSKSRIERQKEFSRVPRDYDEYTKRESVALRTVRGVESRLFLVESMIQIQERQILAMEEWLRDAQTREDRRMTPERETDLRQQIEAEKQQLAALKAECARLREAIERETILVQSQTALISDDDSVRARLWEAIIGEARALEAACASYGGNVSALGRQSLEVVEEALKNAESVGPLVSTIEAMATKGAEEIVAVVMEVRKELEQDVAEAQRTDLELRAFARSEGREVFKRIRERLKGVLLEADLGLVDMAWERTSKAAEALRNLQSDRASKQRGLQEILESLEKARGERVPRSQ